MIINKPCGIIFKYFREIGLLMEEGKSHSPSDDSKSNEYSERLAENVEGEALITIFVEYY